MIDPKNFLSYSVWLALPQDTRYKIAALYGIEARGVRQTTFGHGGGHVVSDGFVHADLAVITKESMSEKTGVESDDFYVQFEALVNLAEGKLNNNEKQKEPTEVESRAEKKVGRPRTGRKA